jgi:hypothetical protein
LCVEFRTVEPIAHHGQHRLQLGNRLPQQLTLALREKIDQFLEQRRCQQFDRFARPGTAELLVRERLEKRLREEKLHQRGQRLLAETLDAPPEDDDDLNAEEQEQLEEELVDRATASQTPEELQAEILILERLEQQAKDVVGSGEDPEWDELSRILQDAPELKDESGRLRKLIIFTEHKDTLNYLHAKIGGVLGNMDAIVTIHGSVKRDDRRRAQAFFPRGSDTRVLIASAFERLKDCFRAGCQSSLQCRQCKANRSLSLATQGLALAHFSFDVFRDGLVESRLPVLEGVVDRIRYLPGGGGRWRRSLANYLASFPLHSKPNRRLT